MLENKWPKADRKGYYRTIRKDLIASVDGAFTKLSDLIKAGLSCS